jgi:succinate dehydrogenase / fumarate reductase, iron-sulfur subunit
MQHLRSFRDGATVRLEPLRSAAFPVLRDLVVDRSALDRVLGAGGWVSVDAGTAPDADTVLVPHDVAERALDLSACIGCGACVAACPNGSASLFVGAELGHLALLPHGRQERSRRARSMTAEADREFGPCSVRGVRDGLPGRDPAHRGGDRQPGTVARGRLPTLSRLALHPAARTLDSGFRSARR